MVAVSGEAVNLRAMKISALVAVGLPFVTIASAAEKSGHAEASLLRGTASYQAGKPVPLGIKLDIDPGWHGYWINPGEGGMPLSAKWTLPEGWKAGELRHPVPKRFMTGELPGFGYEGEAVYLVDLIPPEDASGEAEVKVKLSWLTCSDDACVPGNAELSLTLSAGDGAAGEHAAALAEAGKTIPREAEGMKLDVKEAEGRISLRLSAPEGTDLAGVSVFPATPQVVDAAAPISFALKEGIWSAEVPKNEYADGEIALLDIVLAGGGLERPLVVSWRKGE